MASDTVGTQSFLARFTGARVGFIMNSKRLFIITTSALLGLDLSSRQLKETYEYGSITGATPSASDVRAVTLELDVGGKRKTEGLVLEHRAAFLSELHQAMVAALAPSPVGIFAASATTLTLNPAELAIDSRSFLLRDLIQVYTVNPPANPPEEEAVLVWRNGTQHKLTFRCAANPLRTAFLDALARTIAASLAEPVRLATISPEQETELVDAWACRGQDEPFSFATPVTLVDNVLFDTPTAILALTTTSILFLHPDTGVTLSLNHMRKLFAVGLHVDDDPTRLRLAFTHSLPFVVATPEASALAANLAAMVPALGGHLELRHRPIVPFLPLGPPWMPPSPEREALVLAPLAEAIDAATDSPSAIPAAAAAAAEYLANVRPGTASSKSKRPFLRLAALLAASLEATAANARAAAAARNNEPIAQAPVPELIDASARLTLANALVTALASPALFAEVASSPLLVSLAWDALVSPDLYMTCAGAQLLTAYLVQSFSSKSFKAERANRAAVFDHPDRAHTLTKVIGDLLARPQTPFVSATLATLASLLGSLYASIRAPSTPPAVHAALTAALYTATPTLLRLARASPVGAQRPTINVIRALLEALPPAPFTAVQNRTRSSASLLFFVSLAATSPDVPLRTSAIALVTLLVEGNELSVELLERIFPKPLILRMLAFASDPASANHLPALPYATPWVKSASNPYPPKASPLPLPPAHCGTTLWTYLFDMISVDFFEPTFIWDARTRDELADTLTAELDAFGAAKAAPRPPSAPPLRWNASEFEVAYSSLSSELRVGQFYLDAILARIPDVVLSDPRTFVEELSHELTFGTIPRVRCRILQALSWAYATYMPVLGVYKYMHPLVMLLSPPSLGEVRDHVLLFLAQAFVLRDNIKAFVKAGGLAPLMRLLCNVHTLVAVIDSPVPAEESESLMVGSIILELLILAAELVPSVDDAGYLLVPPPKVKVTLCAPQYLATVAQVVLTHSPQLVDRAILLLDHLVRHNDAAIPTLRATGLVYFLLLHPASLSRPAVDLLALMAPSPALDAALPPRLAALLSTSPSAFLAAFAGGIDSPTIVWNATTADTLAASVASHLDTFLDTLAVDPTATYEYAPIEPVVYPSLEAELVVDGLFLRNLVDRTRFPQTPLPPMHTFLPALLALLGSPGDLAPPSALIVAQAIVITVASAADDPLVAVFPGIHCMLAHLAHAAAHDHVAVAEACAETLLRTLMASPANVASLVGAAGVPALADALAHAVDADDGIGGAFAGAAELVLRCIEVTAANADARSRLLLAPRVVHDVVAAARAIDATPLVRMALRCVAAMSRDGALQDALLGAAAAPALLVLMLRYSPAHVPSAQSALRYQLAVEALEALRALAGVDSASPPNAPVAAALLNLTDGHIASAIADPDTPADAVLGLLATTVTSPTRLWTPPMRAELVRFCRSDDAADASSFAFSALAAEPTVAGLYVAYIPATGTWDPEAEAGVGVAELVAGLVALVRADGAPVAAARALATVARSVPEACAAALAPALATLGAALTTLADAAAHLASLFVALASYEVGLDALAGLDSLATDALLPAARAHPELTAKLLFVVWTVCGTREQSLAALVAGGGVRALLALAVDADGVRANRVVAANVVSNVLRSPATADAGRAELARWLVPFHAHVLLVAPHKFPAVFDGEQARPNVVWTRALAARVVAALADESATGAELDTADELVDELVVDGIFVRLLSEVPAASVAGWLASPADFVEGALARALADDEHVGTLATALGRVLGVVPGACGKGGQVVTGAVAFVGLVVRNTAWTPEVRAEAFGVAAALCRYVEVVSALEGSVGVDEVVAFSARYGDHQVAALDIVCAMVQHVPAFAEQAVEGSTVGILLNILASPSSAVEVDAAAARILLVLTKAPGVGDALVAELEEARNVGIWAPYACGEMPADTTVSLVGGDGGASAAVDTGAGDLDAAVAADDDADDDDDELDIERLVAATRRIELGGEPDLAQTPTLLPPPGLAFAYAGEDEGGDDGGGDGGDGEGGAPVEKKLHMPVSLADEVSSSATLVPLDATSAEVGGGGGAWGEAGVAGEGASEGDGVEGEVGVEDRAPITSTLDMLAQIRMGTQLREVDEAAVVAAREQHRAESGLAGAILAAMEGRRGAMVSDADLPEWESDSDGDW